jgi:hypothetical protein
VPHSSNPLRLNVGFIINLSVGESRDFTFDIPNFHLDTDLDLVNLNGLAHITPNRPRFTRTSQINAVVNANAYGV